MVHSDEWGEGITVPAIVHASRRDYSTVGAILHGRQVGGLSFLQRVAPSQQPGLLNVAVDIGLRWQVAFVDIVAC